MGTRTAGSGATPSGSQIATATDAQWRSNSIITMPEEGYIDTIHVYCGAHNGGNSTFKFCLWDLGSNLLTQTPGINYGTGFGWNVGTLSTGYYHLVGGTQFWGGFQASGQGSQIFTFYPTGHYWLQQNQSTPANFAGTEDTFGFAGDLAWYISYFPIATASLASTHGTEGSWVTVNGLSYSAGVISVTLNGVGCNFNVISDTQLQFQVPTAAAGSVVVNTNAGSATAGTFTVDPIVTSISPSSGGSGTSVTINGSGFTNVSGASGVQFHSGVNASYTVNSDSVIIATCPSGATTGQIVVNGSAASSASSTFTVNTSLTSFSPTTGGLGTAVTLTGVGFTGATAVKFNGTAASYTVVSDTSITTSVPSGATTGPISVTGTGNVATSGSNFVVAPGNYKSGGVLNQLKGAWYHSGGALQPIKGIWYKSGGVLHPLK